MDPTRESLERALADNPDDLATHGAYADYLSEHGDIRGEWIRVELALTQTQPPRRKAAMRRESARLLKSHRAEWLGPFDFASSAGSLRMSYGWIDTLTILTPFGEMLDALPTCPRLRLLRGLSIHDWRRRSDDPDLPRQLAQATNLVALQSLRFTHSDINDDGVAALLDSPLLDRLTTLELTHCNITDDGAQLFATDPRVPRLARFSLENNLLSPIGIEALKEVGVAVNSHQRFGPAGDEFEGQS